MRYLLGLDAGNTKTLAVIAADDGTIIGQGRSGCGDIYGAGSPEKAFERVREAMDSALSCAGLQIGDICAAGFSMAGADWPEDFALLREQIRASGCTQKFVVVNDAIGGLRAGTTDGVGISIILGTGGAIGARGADGRCWHGSFWLRGVHGDNLTQDIYRAVLDAELGMGPATSLTDCLLEAYKLNTVEEVLHASTRREDSVKMPRRRLLTSLFDAWTDRDHVATQIVEQFAKRCSDYARVAAQKVDFGSRSPIPLVFSGGLLRHQGHKLTNLIASLVGESMPIQPVTRPLEPVVGALMLAYDIANLRITQEVAAKLQDSMPLRPFFET